MTKPWSSILVKSLRLRWSFPRYWLCGGNVTKCGPSSCFTINTMQILDGVSITWLLGRLREMVLSLSETWESL